MKLNIKDISSDVYNELLELAQIYDNFKKMNVEVIITVKNEKNEIRDIRLIK